jgi:hypothetical protein
MTSKKLVEDFLSQKKHCCGRGLGEQEEVWIYYL